MTSHVTPTPAILKNIHLLKSFKEDDLLALIQLGTTHEYEPHTNVVIEGELSWGLFLILNGRIGIFKSNKLTGDSYDVGQLDSGSFFGEMSLIDENPRSATVRTLTEASLFFISKEKFMSFLDQSKELKLRFYLNTIRHLVNRLRELDENYVISQYQLWKKVFKKEG